MTLKHLRSSTADKRPQASGMAEGQLAINTASGSPGLFFKDSASNLVKVGPVHVGSGAPNASPASGGTSGNSLGEQWLDTSGGTYVFKIWDGSAWRSEAGEFVNTTGDTMTGALGIIAGSASTPGLFLSGDANSGLYSPGADQVAISTGGSGRLFVNSSGQVGIGTNGSQNKPLHIYSGSSDSEIRLQTNSGTEQNAYLTLRNSGGNLDLYSVNGAITLNPGNTERLRITSAGLVGVGSSSPQAKLEIAQSSDSTDGPKLRIANNGNTLSNGQLIGGIDFFDGDDSGEGVGAYIYSYTTDSIGRASGQDLRFGAGESERMRLDSSGRLGVGTTSPGTALDVNGVITSRSDSFAAVRFRSSTGTDKAFLSYEDGSTSVFLNNYGSGPIVFKTADAERVRIDSSGRVGIGTSVPVNSLQVTASASASVPSAGSSGHFLAVGSSAYGIAGGALTNGNGYLQVTRWDGAATNYDLLLQPNGGRVGIGSTTPGANLQVTATGSASEVIVNSDISTSALASRIGLGNSVGTKRFTIGLLGGGGETAFLGPEGNFPIYFQTNGAERARITSDGKLLVGTSSSSANARAIIQGRTTSATDQGVLYIQRGSSGPGVVADGSGIGEIWFADSNGYAAANIQCLADNTWGGGGNDYPGRLTFSTTADGASSPAERLRITAGGYLKASNDGTYFNATGNYHELGNTNDAPAVVLRTRNASQTDTTLSISPVRAASSAYKMLMCYSGNETDLEFNLRGDGNAYADGSWNGGGADYAEHFEWSDGNPGEEDRRGISVVLDGDKIREAVAGEDPIGVISGNPSVVGDAAWNKWNGKHLRDKFGSYLLDENGERQLNPAFDPEMEYVSRDERPEWDCVGLMGKLRIRKGQITGSRWIKMRDISDSVDEWLVR